MSLSNSLQSSAAQPAAAAQASASCRPCPSSGDVRPLEWRLREEGHAVEQLEGPAGSREFLLLAARPRRLGGHPASWGLPPQLKL